MSPRTDKQNKEIQIEKAKELLKQLYDINRTLLQRLKAHNIFKMTSFTHVRDEVIFVMD